MEEAIKTNRELIVGVFKLESEPRLESNDLSRKEGIYANQFKFDCDAATVRRQVRIERSKATFVSVYLCTPCTCVSVWVGPLECE
jgi:hypothetical protein